MDRETTNGVAAKRFNLANTGDEFAVGDPVTLPAGQFADLEQVGLVERSRPGEEPPGKPKKPAKPRSTKPRARKAAKPKTQPPTDLAGEPPTQATDNSSGNATEAPNGASEQAEQPEA